ncbi:hypothetical protein P8452_11868 [Trifolium repens]|nr:hypothetical protein P8452_11868 [Trifolium repens]
MVWIHLTKLKKKKQNFHLQWNFEILTCPRPLPQSRTYLVPLGRSSTSMPWICGSNLTSRSSQPTRLSRCWLPFSGAVALFVVFETFDDRFNQQRNK